MQAWTSRNPSLRRALARCSSTGSRQQRSTAPPFSPPAASSPRKRPITPSSPRLLKQQLFKESVDSIHYPYLFDYVRRGVELKKLAAELIEGRFDFVALDAAIVADRDYKFDYLGISDAHRPLLCP